MADWQRRQFLALGAGCLLSPLAAHALTGKTADRWARALQHRVTGQVLVRGDYAYETARRRVWSAAVVERFPELILRVAQVQDVVEAVKFAATNNLRVAIRGGGHNWVQPSLRQGGILLDLVGLDEYAIDPRSQVATVGPGISGGTFSHQLSKHGLAFPVAHCPSVPLSGYLLNGGLGWNAGVWGTAASNIIAMDIVTANGELLHASPDTHSDLFWAARGSGPGFFGVVVRFYLRLYTQPAAMQATTCVFPLEATHEIAEWTDTLDGKIAANVEFSFAVAGAPPPYLSPDSRSCVISAIAFADSESEATGALEFMQASPPGSAMKLANLPSSIDMHLEEVARLFPPKARYLGNCMWSNASLAAFYPEFATHLRASPSHRSFSNSVIYPEPAAGTVPLPDAAFSKFEREIVLWYAIWESPSKDQENESWFVTASESLQAHADGFYIGETDLAHFHDNAAQSFSPQNWQKLRSLKTKYDPDGLFFGFWGQENHQERGTR